MDLLRIAAATRCFNQTIKQSVQTAADLGVAGIQLDVRNELRPSELSETGRRQFLHQLEERHLSVASLQFPTRRSYYDLQDLDARVAATKQALQFAYELRSKVVTARLGRIPTEADSEQRRVLVDILNEIARHGNRVGATLCVTPADDSPAALAELLAEVTAGPIGINFDPAIFLMRSYKPADAFRALHASVGHFVVRDAIRDVDGGGAEVAVGRGEVAWDELLALLEEANYRGWLTIDRTSGDDKPGDVGRAVEYLKNVAMG